MASSTPYWISNRDSAGDRDRIRSSSGREIGDLPKIANRKRRAKASKDFRFFCETYFPLVFHLKWSLDHLKIIKKMERAVLRGGLFALAMPRGSGKSSLCEVACIWALINGHREFVCLIGSDEGNAVSMLQSIKIELGSNETLAADYPEVCFPIESLEGISKRCIGQTYGKVRTQTTWSQKEIILPTLKPLGWRTWIRKDQSSLSSGSVIKCAGITGGIRGMKSKRPDGHQIRPDLVIIDDPQTDESAKSVTQCEERQRILTKAILNLAGPGKKIAGVMPLTVIYPGDMADQILDKKDHPEWSGERTKLLIQLPTNEKLWDEYGEIRAEGLRNDDGGKAGNEMYASNREAMDIGARPAWPERFEPGELSAIQFAMNLKLRDEAAFWSEYQNEPLPIDKAADAIPVEKLREKANGQPGGSIGPDVSRITAYIDVQGKLLYWLAVGWADNFTGEIVGYGAYPDQGVPYYTLGKITKTLARAAPGTGFEGALYAGLEKLTADIFTRKYEHPDGSTLQIERCLIDVKWPQSTEIIYQFCRQTDFGAILTPARGVGVTAASKPFSEYRKQQGDRIGHHWRMPNVRGKRSVRAVAIDTNYWKTFANERLVTSMGDFGCLSVFGKPASHRMLFDHLSSEFFVETQGRGRTVQEWKMIPGRENHLWDCLVGACVAASVQGVTMEFFGPVDPERRKRKKVNLREARERARAKRR